MIEEPHVVVHKAYAPDFLADLLDADVLSGKYSAQVDLSTTDADPAATGDGDGSVVEGVFEVVAKAPRLVHDTYACG